MTHVVIAADKFKGSLTAQQVGAAIETGLRRTRPAIGIRRVPIADGGDGTLEALSGYGFSSVDVVAAGPTGLPTRTRYLRSGPLAVIELAAVSGVLLLPAGPAPMTATSRGTGELIAAALDAGCRRIVLGVGGSAGTDGGAGMLQAVGAGLFDADGAEIGSGGAGLTRLAAVDLTGLHPGLAAAEVVLATDVDNPLTGPAGAAAVYGPQKGTSPDQVAELDEALGRYADLVAAATGRDLRNEPGAGASGGVGFAAIAVLAAQVRPGIEIVLELVDFDRVVAGADLVITGEGSLDEQTLAGKAPAGVAAAARRAGVPVIAVCGRNLLTPAQISRAGFAAVHSLGELEPDPARSMARAGQLLERVAERIGAGLRRA